nr:hypothetical protein [uncultured Ottowia sp.]
MVLRLKQAIDDFRITIFFIQTRNIAWPADEAEWILHPSRRISVFCMAQNGCFVFFIFANQMGWQKMALDNLILEGFRNKRGQP